MFGQQSKQTDPIKLDVTHSAISAVPVSALERVLEQNERCMDAVMAVLEEQRDQNRELHDRIMAMTDPAAQHQVTDGQIQRLQVDVQRLAAELGTVIAPPAPEAAAAGAENVVGERPGEQV